MHDLPRSPRHLKDLARFVALLASTCLVAASSSAQSTTITIDPSITYQTIQGWGCVSNLPEYLTPDYRGQLLNEVVNEYGLNRMRIEPPAGNATNVHRWERLNDNNDSLNTDWLRLNIADLDKLAQNSILPFAALVRANGDPFVTYLSYSFYNSGSSGTVPPWILNNPGEYAEFAMSLLNRLKHAYGIDPTYLTILNEPTYDNNFTVPIINEMVKIMGPKLEAAGFSTKIQYPETLNIDVAYNSFVLPNVSDSELWSWIKLISYHRYGGATQSANLLAFAQSKGIPTAFTEQLATGLNLDLLFTDLTTMNASSWEIYSMGSEINLDQTHFNFFEPGNGNYYWRFRQVFHYVRPGAVRVAATSDVSGPKIMAWEKDGKSILNFYNMTTKPVIITGLKPGTYGLCSARQTASYVEQGVYTVGQNGILNLTLPDTVPLYTLYPRSSANFPPVFTSFKPSASYLVPPSTSFTLSAAAQDPDKNTVTYSWTVNKSPTGATVTLATPGSASCVANGLTVAGDYTFTVTASDGAASTERQVFMRVFPSNPPPVIIQIHNRIPVVLSLPSQTSTTIRSNIFNVDGDGLTYQWNIVAQPAGASAQFTTPTANDTDLTSMTAAGDYVVNLTVSDGTTTISKDHTIVVYPPNGTPTVSASVSPNAISLPTSSTMLSSTSSDPNGNLLSHWWRCTSRPAGSYPNIAHPTSANTAVSGMIVPGTYNFEHVVTDEWSFKKSALVAVNVGLGASPEIISIRLPNGGENFEPGQTVNIRWSTANYGGDVKLEFFDGLMWSAIAASTANDGAELWTVPQTVHSGCKIRISDPTDASPSDESDGTFRIIGPDIFKIIKVDLSSTPNPTVEWTSLPGGYSYQVYYSDTLNSGDWHDIGPVFVAQNNEYTLRYTDTTANAGTRARFYKVVETSF